MHRGSKNCWLSRIWKMESSNQLPFDVEDRQANRWLYSATLGEPLDLQKLNQRVASAAGINPTYLERLRRIHEERQSQFDLSPPHARYEALQHGCSSGCETPIPFAPERRDVVVATQTPRLRGWVQRVLQKLQPSQFACGNSLETINIM